MARNVLKLPKVADTADEVVVLEWLVDVGAEVAEGEPLVSLETDKVNVELPSPIAGTLVEILAEVDSEITTGSPLCVIET